MFQSSTVPVSPSPLFVSSSSSSFSSFTTPARRSSHTSALTPSVQSSPSSPCSDSSPSVSMFCSSSSPVTYTESSYCGVCFDGEASDPSNPMVYCDGCDLAVHVECFGSPLNVQIPEDEWFCDRCRWEIHSGMKERGERVSCCLCPVRIGAMKRTTDWRFAHLSCAQWIPEVFFRCPDSSDLIDILSIPKYKHGRECSYCSSSYGVATECSEPGCTIIFHVTCGLSNDVYFEYKKGQGNAADVIIAYCPQHAKRWRGKKGKAVVKAIN
jgi:hypothetical protein